LVILAVKSTLAPAQIGIPGLETILMVGVTNGFTIMAMLLEVTFIGLAQAAFEVKITVTISPLFNPDELKVFELIPVLTPFICH
jgi:hypothetical protein